MKPATTATERKTLLLQHPDISTWIKDRPRPGTATTQLDHVRIFLDRTGLDVDGFVRTAKGDVRKLKNVVLDFVREEQDRGLKAKYGDRLVFWGGGVDTQKTLPFGTPAEVREQVLERCEVFSKGGGFVFNPVHNIQAKTPVENVAAMVEAIREFNGSKSKETHA